MAQGQDSKGSPGHQYAEYTYKLRKIFKVLYLCLQRAVNGSIKSDFWEGTIPNNTTASCIEILTAYVRRSPGSALEPIRLT